VHPAGHALVVAALALLLGGLLNAQGIYKAAYNQPSGFKRDLGLAFAGPARDVSHALLLDRPRQWLKNAIGRGDDDRIDVSTALPAAQAGSGDAATTPTPAGANATPSPAVPAKQAFTPANKLRVWIAGDSLVITPGWAVVRAAGASPVINALGVDGRVATGLERPDIFNWFTYVAEQMKALKPKAVVLCFGGNDDHGYMTGLPDGMEVDTFGDRNWQIEYARRVGGLMDTIIRRGSVVVWIGLPVTSSESQSERFQLVNAVVQAEARKRSRKVAFVDTHALFMSASGGYSQYLQDSTGRLEKMRADDGVHFERAGGDIIAREVLQDLNRFYDLTSWQQKAR
jgi:hypothetical protein